MPGEFILKALTTTVEVLRACGIDACVMGGMSVIHWGHLRYTEDVDLLIGIEPSNIENLVHRLASVGVRARRNPVVSRVGDHSFIQFYFTPRGRFEEIPVDLLIADSEFFRGVLSRAIPARHGSVEARVVSCEDLIILKLQADRILDRADVRFVLEKNRDRLDFAYLTQWIERFGLQKEWTEWWAQAFPGEPAPGSPQSGELSRSGLSDLGK